MCNMGGGGVGDSVSPGGSYITIGDTQGENITGVSPSPVTAMNTEPLSMGKCWCLP